jgi:hypothetical protein
VGEAVDLDAFVGVGDLDVLPGPADGGQDRQVGGGGQRGAAQADEVVADVVDRGEGGRVGRAPVEHHDRPATTQVRGVISIGLGGGTGTAISIGTGAGAGGGPGGG